ncbi:hypothetical protein OE88DRAFT_1666258, partial [Heliocybe sulcata]
MTHFLRAIFKPGHYDQTITKDFTFFMSILRLSVKYDAAVLRSQVVSQLSQYFPTTLHAWDDRDDCSLAHLLKGREPIIVDTALTSTHLSCLLPAALYMCCWDHPLECLIDGFPANGCRFLPWPTVRSCLLAKEKMRNDVRILFKERALLMFSWYCRSSRCIPGLDRWRVQLEEEQLDNLYNVLSLGEPDSIELCSECAELCEGTIADIRAEIWSRLPSYFGLPDWRALRQRATD